MKFPLRSASGDRILVSPSLLSADAAAYGRDVALVSELCDSIHVDVMDGCFVPNISFGLPVLRAIKSYTDKPFDVHLMIQHPENFIEDFVAAGADLITVHVETAPHLHRVIDQIHMSGVAAGVTLNPASPLCLLDEILPYVDLVLLMSVNPGFGGQKFISTSLDKIRRLKHMIDERGLDVHIQVDGGVCAENAASIAEAGANVLVAGSAIFNAADPLDAIRNLQQCRL